MQERTIKEVMNLDTRELIYADDFFLQDENIIWRVETNKTVPDKLPYENMSISKDKSKIYATDFYGRRSIIDIQTGYIEYTDCVK